MSVSVPSRARRFFPRHWVMSAVAGASLLACASAPQVNLSETSEQFIARVVPGGKISYAQSADKVSAVNVAAPAAADPAEGRFSDPDVDYETPAFAEGRVAYTTQVEMSSMLRNLALASANDKSSETQVQLLKIGQSQAGVPIEGLLFSRRSSVIPLPAVKDGRPTVLLLAQQHGDEPAGAEALLVVAQGLAEGGGMNGLLDLVNVIVVPRVNPDGAATGQALTRNRIDANRDHLLLRTPEARAVAQVIQEFQPVMVLESREYAEQSVFAKKFGALQRYDALLGYATTVNQPEFVVKAAEEWFRQPMLDSLRLPGLTAEWPHTTSGSLGDRMVSMEGLQADSERNVMALRNMVSLSVDSRGRGLGRKNLKRRVFTQVTLIGSALRSAADRAAELMRLRRYVDNAVREQACLGKVVLDAKMTPGAYTLQLVDPATGADTPVPVTWNSALALTEPVVRPRPCGYWLAADQSEAVARLGLLGVKVEKLSAAAVYQTGTPPAVNRGGAFTPADLAEFEAPADSYYVPLSQPLANLAIAVLDPGSPHGYVANGLINSSDRVARVATKPKGKRTLLP